jgi:DNA-damage-inducible protein J
MLTSEIRSRIERELKQEAQDVLSRVGLNISDAIRLFLRQVVVAKGLPFEIREVPNAATRAAMLEARQVKKKKRSHKASGNRGLTPI